MVMMTNRIFLGGLLTLPILAPTLAHAYVGPGAGLGAIGTVIALLAALLLGIVGFVWYPIKRLLNRRQSTEPEVADSVTPDMEHAEGDPVPESQE